MKKINHEDMKILNEPTKFEEFQNKRLDKFFRKVNIKLFIFIILSFSTDLIILVKFPYKSVQETNNNNKINLDNRIYFDNMYKADSLKVVKSLMDMFMEEKNRIYLREINKKRTFEKRLPLPKEINCRPHLTQNELIAFLSFLTKDTIYFETGSGCSSLIAKYYTKKSYAVEGCKDFYEQGIKNGLKNNLIFHDLKPDNPLWSYPGKKSNINDWKKYFQSYDKSYNADVILLDGRFKIATAMDIFDKINDDTIVFIHEYQERPSYFVLENYYNYIYHWGTLVAFNKKKDIKTIPLEIQKEYWKNYL